MQTDGQTLVVSGRHLTSRHHRAQEAVMQASTVPPEADEAWVYGWGLGDIQRELLKRPAIKRLVVVPLNQEIFFAAIDFEPQEWVRDPRVEVVLPDEITDVCVPCCVYPADLRLADRNAWWLRDRLMALLNQPFNAFLFQWMNTVWSSHLAGNKACLDVDPDVSALTGTDDRPAIVVGGGPTLGLAYDWIKRQGMNVIAASTALRPLLAAGIEPDVVVVIDRDPKMAKHFEKRCAADLVYHPQCHPSIASGWPSRRFVVHDHGLFSGGSVIHNQLDLAVRMGAKQVYLVGLDFGYPGRVSHVAGAPLPYEIVENAATLTVNGHGEDIATDPNLLQYRVCAEDFIASHPEVMWRKLGRDGSAMRGVEWEDAT